MRSEVKTLLTTFQYEAEKMETGGVSFAVYMYYIANMGLALFFFAVFFYTVSQEQILQNFFSL
jgi:hypothetical protein